MNAISKTKTKTSTRTAAVKRKSKTTTTTAKQQRRRVARPATSKKAIEAARVRTQELLAVLRIRGKPVDRDKMTSEQRKQLECGPYPRAAAVYLATHEKFVEAQVRKVSARHVPDEDVAQAVRIGMVRSLDKFDQRLIDNGTVTSFLSYARWWVRCEVGKLLEDESLVRIPSAAKKVATEMRARVDVMAAAIDAAPEYLTDEDVAAGLGITLERVRTYRHLHLGHEHYDATAPEMHRDKLEPGEDAATQMVTDRLTELQADVADDAMWKLREGGLEVALQRLPPSHRRVVADSFGVGVDSEAASVQLPGSVVAVRALLKAALGRLRQMLDVDLVAV